MLVLVGILLVLGGAAWHIGEAMVAYPAQPPVGPLALTALGALAAVAGFARKRSVLRGLGGGLGLGLAALFWYWVLAYSVMDTPEPRLRIGEPIPEFKLLDEQGRGVTRAGMAGKKAVLIFYRGEWCPFCVADLGKIQAEYRALTDAGARVYAISGDPPQINKALRERLGGEITLLTDPDLEYTSRLGIVHKNANPMTGEDAPYPLTVLLDERGVVRWTHRPATYRVRTPVGDILAHLAEIAPFEAPAEKRKINTNIVPP